MTQESVTLKHKISTTTNPINFKSLLAPRYSSIVQEKNYSGYLARVLSAGDSLDLFFTSFFLGSCTHLPLGARFRDKGKFDKNVTLGGIRLSKPQGGVLTTPSSSPVLVPKIWIAGCPLNSSWAQSYNIFCDQPYIFMKSREILL